MIRVFYSWLKRSKTVLVYERPDDEVLAFMYRPPEKGLRSTPAESIEAGKPFTQPGDAKPAPLFTDPDRGGAPIAVDEYEFVDTTNLTFEIPSHDYYA